MLRGLKKLVTYGSQLIMVQFNDFSLFKSEMYSDETVHQI
jgi:hypothetical protein